MSNTKPTGRIMCQTGPKRAEGGGGFWHEIGVELTNMESGARYLSIQSWPTNPNFDGFLYVFPVREGDRGGRRRSGSGPAVSLPDMGGGDAVSD